MARHLALHKRRNPFHRISKVSHSSAHILCHSKNRDSFCKHGNWMWFKSITDDECERAEGAKSNSIWPSTQSVFVCLAVCALSFSKQKSLYALWLLWRVLIKGLRHFHVIVMPSSVRDRSERRKSIRLHCQRHNLLRVSGFSRELIQRATTTTGKKLKSSEN